jgi:hypothetical protein
MERTNRAGVRAVSAFGLIATSLAYDQFFTVAHRAEIVWNLWCSGILLCSRFQASLSNRN